MSRPSSGFWSLKNLIKDRLTPRPVMSSWVFVIRPTTSNSSMLSTQKISKSLSSFVANMSFGMKVKDGTVMKTNKNESTLTSITSIRSCNMPQTEAKVFYKPCCTLLVIVCMFSWPQRLQRNLKRFFQRNLTKQGKITLISQNIFPPEFEISQFLG